jgi:type II secretory pathway pseudopilin PulG
MHRRHPFRSHPPNPERGYILLTLMLVVSLLAIAALALAPDLAFQTRRDREEELIHRGVQYSRAIRGYFKKFGRYPSRIEDLENTNNLRFLRKRYKDPITGQDFKLLHFGDAQMSTGGAIAGATPVSAMAGAAMAGGAIAGANSVSAMAGAAMAGAAMAGAAGAGASPAGASPTGAQGFSLGPAATGAAGQSQPGPATTPADSDTASGSSGGQAASAGGNPSSSQVFGGGPIIGVVSASKAESIREFNNKNHYNQWQFIYDPGSDRGGLLNTPAQPPLQGSTQNGQTGMPGTAPPAAGAGTGFGSSSGAFGSGMGGSGAGGSGGSGTGSFGSQPLAQSTPPPASPPQQP